MVTIVAGTIVLCGLAFVAQSAPMEKPNKATALARSGTYKTGLTKKPTEEKA